MVNSGSKRVRPTLRALIEDLGLSIPLVDDSLADLDHDIIQRAQGVPEKAAANGAERILSLKDRVWLKVKSGRWRGAATDYVHDPESPKSEWFSGWWLGFVGTRADGDRGDAYATARARSRVSKDKGSTGIDTGWMLPTARDANRRIAEFAAREEAAMYEHVRAAIAESARTGRVLSTIYGHHTLEVLVKAPDNETYLAVGMTGVYRAEEIAAVLGCIPGVAPDSWGAEPGDVLGITPHAGQVIYSTILDPRELGPLLEENPEGTLDIS